MAIDFGHPPRALFLWLRFRRYHVQRHLFGSAQITIGIVTPTRSSVSRRCRSSMWRTGLPSSSMTRRPRRRPGLGGGAVFFEADDQHAGLHFELMEADDAPVQRHVLAGDADEAPLDPAIANEPGGNELGGVAGDGKADSLRGGNDRRVDADHPPARSTSGPPELPGFRAASVWITLSTSRPAPVRNERARLLTTPAVTVYWNP